MGSLNKTIWKCIIHNQQNYTDMKTCQNQFDKKKCTTYHVFLWKCECIYRGEDAGWQSTAESCRGLWWSWESGEVHLPHTCHWDDWRQRMLSSPALLSLKLTSCQAYDGVTHNEDLLEAFIDTLTIQVCHYSTVITPSSINKDEMHRLWYQYIISKENLTPKDSIPFHKMASFVGLFMLKKYFKSSRPMHTLLSRDIHLNSGQLWSRT